MNLLALPDTSQRKRPWPPEDTPSTPPAKRYHQSNADDPTQDLPSSWSATPDLSTGSRTRDGSLTSDSPSNHLSFHAQLDFDLPDACSPQDAFASPGSNFVLESTLAESDVVELPGLDGLVEAPPAVIAEELCEASPTDEQNSDPEDLEICYGLICDIKVEPRWVPPDHSMDFVEVTDEGQWFLTLRFSFHEDLCIIETQKEEKVAMLNRKSFDALHDLPGTVHVEGLVTKNEWSECLAAVEKGTKSIRMSIDAELYGPPAEAGNIAKKLSKSGLFLQHPYFNARKLTYHNPQYFDLSHLVFFDVSAPPGSFDFQDTEGSANEGIAQIEESFDYEGIMDEAPQHQYLIEAPTDSDTRILSPLLSHQKTAVDFIRRRETGDSPSEESLWEDLGSTPACYKHRITGFNNDTPQDALGGILADEMGLGKSLTMLARIVGSLPHANEFAGPRGITLPPDGEGIVSAKSTLIVVPSALLLDSWVDEIRNHVRPGTLRYHKYHGQNRQIDRAALIEHDVVITTYGTVAAELRRHTCMLENINWYRLVLDEAHVIRNWSTKQFKAVSTISAHIRWCLSGTPIQNSLEDLGALVKFLQLPVLKEGNNFNTYITRKTMLAVPAAKRDFENLRCLLGSICLRRNKGVLQMEQSKYHTYPIEFIPEERAQYNKLKRRCQQAIDMAVSGRKAKETHQSVLEALLRLRLFCNNGDVPSLRLSPEAAEETLSCMQQSGEAVCGYCSCDVLSLGGCGDPEPAILTNCRRFVCGECTVRYRADIEEHRNLEDHFECPLCKKDHDHDEPMFEAVDEIEAESTTERTYPSKLKVLLKDVQENSNGEKSVIFSFWKRTLDLVGDLFKENNVSFFRVDGSLPFGARKAVLSDFQTSTNTKVLLMTLGTGAVGLNSLSVASRLHILEPQWNPSVESQAVGRVLRLGQKRTVTIIRYIVNNTVEQSVQNRQQHKVVLSRGGFKGESKQKAQLQNYAEMIS